MKKAKAMYIPAGGKKAVWGPVDQNVLPEGYPYKEVTVTKEPVDLSLSEYWLDEIPREDWVQFSPGMQMYTYCKISDGTLSNDDVRKLSIAMTWDGELKTINYSDLPDNAFIIEDDYVVVNSELYPTTIIVRKPNALVRVSTRYDDLVLFNKVGFYIDDRLNGPASIKTVEPVFTFTTETIHPMAPEFLPAGVGGGGAMVTKIAPGSNGLESSIPYSEIRNAWVNNIPCFARFMVQDEASMMFWPQGLSFASEGETEDITFIGWNGSMFLAIKIDANDAVSTINISLS